MLDEVSEIEPKLQAKLLRVLEEQEFERVGSSETLRVDVRILATTNRDLRQAVAEGQFREDLYYRLNVVPIYVPPLSERREDIPLLAQHFLARFQRREGGAIGLGPECIDLLCRYDWPGNVRELEHLMERLCVLGAGEDIQGEDLAAWLSSPGRMGGPQFAPGTPLEEVEREMIRATLDRLGGHRVRTAEALGISVRTLGMKVKAYGLADVGRRTVSRRGQKRQDLPVAAQ